MRGALEEMKELLVMQVEIRIAEIEAVVDHSVWNPRLARLVPGHDLHRVNRCRRKLNLLYQAQNTNPGGRLMNNQQEAAPPQDGPADPEDYLPNWRA